MHRNIALILLPLLISALNVTSTAGVIVEGQDPRFVTHVRKELNSMRGGKRGVVCKELMERLDMSPSTTTIRPLTSDERTWHPNDRRGTRSNLVAIDTKIRGGGRSVPTASILYFHPNRVDPNLSMYRLGSLAFELALACDLNYGQFSPDYKVREKRAVFFRNAWCDSLGYNLIEISDRIPTDEYQKAKELGLINEENRELFPILELELFIREEEPLPSQNEQLNR